MANGKNNVTYIYSKTLSFYCLYVAMWRSQSETLKVCVGWETKRQSWVWTRSHERRQGISRPGQTWGNEGNIDLAQNISLQDNHYIINDNFLQSVYSHLNICLTKQISDTADIDPITPMSTQTSASYIQNWSIFDLKNRVLGGKSGVWVRAGHAVADFGELHISTQTTLLLLLS